MRVAALADIHGNVHALEAVLADERCAAADLVVVLGDIVGGAFPGETLDLVLALGERVRCLRGNADRLVLEEAHEVSEWRRKRLGGDRLAAVAEWPQTFAVDVTELGRVRCCHATPRSDEEIVTWLTPEEALLEALAGTSEDVVIGGHTHVQLDRVVGRYRFVNAGSVGWPYEGRRGAYWALLGPDVELVRTDYDVEAAAAAMRASGHPEAEQHAPTLLEPPTAAEATVHFEALRGA